MKTCKECGFKRGCFWPHVPPPSISFNGPEWTVLERILEQLAMDAANNCPDYEEHV